jgi:glycosyltransferase involved in cell wall biosynthesis
MEILNKVKKKIPSLKVICFGFKKKKEFPEFIKFIENPSNEQIRQIYNESHIFLFSSIQEGYGLPPAEAMACKCVPISTKTGAIPEYIKNDVNGYLVDHTNIFEMIEIICDLNKDRKKLKEKSEMACLTVREFFDWEKITDKFEKYLTEG